MSYTIQHYAGTTDDWGTSAAPTFTTSETDPFSSYGPNTSWEINTGSGNGGLGCYSAKLKKAIVTKIPLLDVETTSSRGTQNSTRGKFWVVDISDSYAFTEVSNLRADISGNTSGETFRSPRGKLLPATINDGDSNAEYYGYGNYSSIVYYGSTPYYVINGAYISARWSNGNLPVINYCELNSTTGIPTTGIVKQKIIPEMYTRFYTEQRGTYRILTRGYSSSYDDLGIMPRQNKIMFQLGEPGTSSACPAMFIQGAIFILDKGLDHDYNYTYEGKSGFNFLKEGGRDASGATSDIKMIKTSNFSTVLGYSSSAVSKGCIFEYVHELKSIFMVVHKGSTNDRNGKKLTFWKLYIPDGKDTSDETSLTWTQLDNLPGFAGHASPFHNGGTLSYTNLSGKIILHYYYMGGDSTYGRYQHQSWIREYTINSGDSTGSWTDSKEIVSNWSTNFIKKYWTNYNNYTGYVHYNIDPDDITDNQNYNDSTSQHPDESGTNQTGSIYSKSVYINPYRVNIFGSDGDGKIFMLGGYLHRSEGVVRSNMFIGIIPPPLLADDASSYTQEDTENYLKTVLGDASTVATMSKADIQSKRKEQVKKLLESKVRAKPKANLLFNTAELAAKSIPSNAVVSLAKADFTSIADSKKAENRASMKKKDTASGGAPVVVYAPLDDVNSFVSFSVNEVEYVTFKKSGSDPNKYLVYENDNSSPNQESGSNKEYEDDDEYIFTQLDGIKNKFYFGSVTGTVVDDGDNVFVNLNSQTISDSSGIVMILEGMVVSSSLSILPSVKVVTRDICGNAVANYDISLSDISGVFVYTKHKSTPDVSYNTFPQHWDKNSTLKYSDAIVNDNTKIGPYANPKIKEDLVRHQAQEILGSYVGADIFQNENELKNEHTIIDVSLNAAIKQLLTQSTKTDTDDDTTNFTRELLYQLQAVDLNRVSDTLTALNEITKVVSVSSGKFYIDGVEAPALTLVIGKTYTFDQSDATNNGHPLRFYDDVNKSNLYSIGVDISGTPGSAGAYTKINIANSTVSSFAYQCSVHGAMGNTVTRADAPEDTVIEIPFIVGDILTIKVIYDPPANTNLQLNKNKADVRSYLIKLRIT